MVTTSSTLGWPAQSQGLQDKLGSEAVFRPGMARDPAPLEYQNSIVRNQQYRDCIRTDAFMDSRLGGHSSSFSNDGMVVDEPRAPTSRNH